MSSKQKRLRSAREKEKKDGEFSDSIKKISQEIDSYFYGYKKYTKLRSE